MMWPARIIGMCSGIGVLVLLFLQRGAAGETHQLYSTNSGFLYLLLIACIVAIVVSGRKKPQT
jgi:hypothetical protein